MRWLSRKYITTQKADFIFEIVQIHSQVIDNYYPKTDDQIINDLNKLIFTDLSAMILTSHLDATREIIFRNYKRTQLKKDFVKCERFVRRYVRSNFREAYYKVHKSN